MTGVLAEEVLLVAGGDRGGGRVAVPGPFLVRHRCGLVVDGGRTG
jgi:hypothetical protein